MATLVPEDGRIGGRVAACIKLCKLRVEAVTVHALGGSCEYSGAVTTGQRVFVAWGGVLAQGLALVLVSSLAPLLHGLAVPFIDRAVERFLMFNLVVMVLNMIPLAPLDGADAWRTDWLRERIDAWRLRRRARRPRRTHPPSKGKLIRLEEHRRNRKVLH